VPPSAARLGRSPIGDPVEAAGTGEVQRFAGGGRTQVPTVADKLSFGSDAGPRVTDLLGVLLAEPQVTSDSTGHTVPPLELLSRLVSPPLRHVPLRRFVVRYSRRGH